MDNRFSTITEVRRVAWPAYETSRRHTMVFGSECRAAPAPFEEERAVWASMVEPAKIR